MPNKHRCRYPIQSNLTPSTNIQHALRHRTPPLGFLSRSFPKLSSILWRQPDDEYSDDAEEYVAGQYDREIDYFYLEAQVEAFAKHWAKHYKHVDHAEDQTVPE